MIKIRIRNTDDEIDVQFPINENELYAKLAEIHAIEGRDAPQSACVTEVYYSEELSMLKDRFLVLQTPTLTCFKSHNLSNDYT